MNTDTLKQLLQAVKGGGASIDDAVLALKKAPFEDIGCAKTDTHRALRQGVGEVVYGSGKTIEQLLSITRALMESGQKRVLVTRVTEEKANALISEFCAEYYSDANIALIGGMPKPSSSPYIVVATGGTSDIPVAEEAAVTAMVLGNNVERLYDVGVAGLHRLLSHLDLLMQANVIIAIAGMEGALCSVIAGLVSCPVIGVPTSVGYGASMGGLSALLSMLNSCASGVSVVNIDNGFGAGYLASMINHMGENKN